MNLVFKYNSKKNIMSRVLQKSDSHGSLKDIQVLINNNQNLINALIRKSFKDFDKDEIEWVSPIQSDGFAEYRDDDFIEKIGLNPEIIQLNKFWPKGGPQWDALGKTKNGRIILIEAKANIPEIVSPSTKASIKSKQLIEMSLNETKLFLNINNDISWSGIFYQYTNRIAHLFFLREKCKRDAYLINLYFVGDKTVSGPKNQDEWNGAITVVKKYLGVSNHKLKKYMTDIFINVNELMQ